MTHQTRTATDIDRAASQIAGCLWDDREQTGTLAEQLRACADTTPAGTDGDLTSEDRQALRDLADEAEALDDDGEED